MVVVQGCQSGLTKPESNGERFYIDHLGFKLSDYIICDLGGFHVDIAPGSFTSVPLVDGEVAMVLEARLLLGPRHDLEAPLDVRIAAIERAMGESPTVSGESYPDEAWTFCNTTALAALRMHDARVGTDHGPLARRWLTYAKAHLIDPKTGIAQQVTGDGLTSKIDWR